VRGKRPEGGPLDQKISGGFVGREAVPKEVKAEKRKIVPWRELRKMEENSFCPKRINGCVFTQG